MFDASAKKHKSILSLSQCLHKGPALASMLYEVLLRICKHKVVLVGDIQKAFLQIEIKEKVRNSSRFLSTSDIFTDNPEIEVYQFFHIIFRAGPSLYLLNAILHHHLKKPKDKDPGFAGEMQSSLYIDDLVSGSGTVEEAYSMFMKAKRRLREAGFHMHNWETNRKELREPFKREEITFEMPNSIRKRTHLKE